MSIPSSHRTFESMIWGEPEKEKKTQSKKQLSNFLHRQPELIPVL